MHTDDVNIYILWSNIDLSTMLWGGFSSARKGFFHHLSCLPRSFRSFDIAGLTSAFFLLKNAPNCWFSHKVFAISVTDLFCLFTLMMASITQIDSLDHILTTPVKQLPNANSTPEINTRPLICFICLEVTRKKTAPGNETTSQSIVQVLLSPWKWRYCI